MIMILKIKISFKILYIEKKGNINISSKFVSIILKNIATLNYTQKKTGTRFLYLFNTVVAFRG